MTAVWLLPPLAYSALTGEPVALVVMSMIYVLGGLIGYDRFIRCSEDSSQTLTTGCVPRLPSGTTNVFKFKKAA